MALYDYRCPEGHLSEEYHPISADVSEVDCHECDKRATRIISRNTFHLKGSGWHQTDYVRENTTVGSED